MQKLLIEDSAREIERGDSPRRRSRAIQARRSPDDTRRARRRDRLAAMLRQKAQPGGGTSRR
jgi:hypothetical protein